MPNPTRTLTLHRMPAASLTARPQRAAGGGGRASAGAHQAMNALTNWMSSRMSMSTQLPMAASTSTASQIMMGMGMTSCAAAPGIGGMGMGAWA